MKAKLALVVTTALIALAGCAKQGESTSMSSNQNFAVERLFTHDGCTVYRFDDSGRSHYFTKCPNSVDTSSHYTESCGKGCTTDVESSVRTTQ